MIYYGQASLEFANDARGHSSLGVARVSRGKDWVNAAVLRPAGATVAALSTAGATGRVATADAVPILALNTRNTVAAGGRVCQDASARRGSGGDNMGTIIEMRPLWDLLDTIERVQHHSIGPFSFTHI